MIEYLIRRYQDTLKIAVLSRGYRRKSKGFILASEQSTVEELGDEPYQIHSKFPGISVAVDADRLHGIEQLRKKVGPNLILLDDAFQHRRVKADLNVLLTSYGHLYVDDWYLPTGGLRDSISQAQRADYIVVTKCPETLSSGERERMRTRLNPKDTKKVLFSYLHYADTLRSDKSTLALKSLRGKQVTLITGIANPEPLLRFLKAQDITVVHLAFKDHHFFTPAEIQEFNSRDFLITTEKDYVRLKGKVAMLFYLPIRHVFPKEDEGILKSGLEVFMRPNP